MPKHRKILGAIVAATRLLSGAILLALIGPAAHAAILFSGWNYTSFAGPGFGESAVVAEGILYDTAIGSAGAPAYDYIFEVANTGVAPIAAFGGGTGAPGAVLYNSDISFGLPGLPASGPVNPAGPLPGIITQVPPAQAGKRLPGGWGGANNPFLPIVPVTPYTPLYPGGRGLFSPNYQYWGFEISSTGFGYALGWYNLVGNQIFNGGLVTRFDLNSTLGPIPGGAFIDPPASSSYILDWANGDFLSLPTPSIPDPNTTFCNPATDPSCSPDIIPPNIASLNLTGFGAPVPEPDSLSLLGAAILGLCWIGYRRRRSSTMMSPG
jgi:hypothetical protein